MPNKHKIWNREDWISIVTTIAFILGFLLLANEATITGFTTVQQTTTFEINDIVPAAATLEILSNKQILDQIPVKELTGIQPILQNNTITAYNITNITIDITSYNIESSENITIRFIEIYKEITKQLKITTTTQSQEITFGIQAGDNVYETGIIETNGWTTINTKITYTMPIIVARPREGYSTSADHEIATAIITNITSTSFKVQLRNESSVLNGNISYIVIENGTHKLSNGMLLQAGRFEPVDYYDANSDSTSSYKSITFPTAYASAPVVIASPNNASANDWVSVRYDVGSLTTTGISISLEIDNSYGNAPIAASPTNSIAWIAMNATSATNMEAGIEVGVDEDPTAGDWRTLTFSNTYTTLLFFGMQEEDTGTDPCTIGIHNLTSTSTIDIRLAEERTDGEQTHATEDVLWMVFESGLGNNAPTIPTNITCDGNNNCNITVDTSVKLNATGSTDAGGDNITYFIEASLLNKTTSVDQESGEIQAIATAGGVTTIGETGNVTASDSLVWTWVNYQGTYSSTPVVIATPVTYTNCAGTCSGTSAGNGGMYPIPVVKDVSTTGFNFSMCIDGGSTTCTTGASSETFDYFVFDVDMVSSLSWIDVGTLTVTTAGADTTLTYGKTFTNTPVIWTTPQTYNQGGNIAAHVWAEDTATKSTTLAPLIGCVHQGIADACATSQPSETVGYVAIDTANVNINTFQTGSADISDSAWTATTFSPAYTNPRVMVTQNDDDGGQDPEYAWARSVTGSGMDFRYCEEDAGDVCNTHTGEVTNWFAIEDGDIIDGSGSGDSEANKDWETYNNIFSSNWKNITDLNVTVYVSVYNKSGSTESGNNNPDLQLAMYNSTDFVNVANLSVNETGNFNLTISDQSILTAWQTLSNTDLRIRAVNMDYNSTSYIDEINWTGLWITINGTEWNLLGNHTNITTLTWDTTNIDEQTCIDLRARAKDIDGSNSYSSYFTKGNCLNINHAAANNPPTIPVENITQISDTDITLDSSKEVSFTFVACDPENNIQSAFANMTGEDSFFDSNLTCQATGWTNTTCKQFNCSMNIWYFYKAGSYNFSMNVTDGTYWTHNNGSTFTLGSTTGMVMAPSALTWSTLYLGQWNQTTDDDPILINNTGNYNVSLGKVNITGYDLKGEETTSEYIPAINFTAHIETDANKVECLNTTTKGVGILNQTSVDILGSMLPRGNHSKQDGTAQEQLYFCLVNVPYGISEQSYSTENSQQWIIGVS